MSDHETELYRQSRAHQDKYIYFLLAAAGACIAFALTQTASAKLSWWHLPLAGAALCWAGSFYAGCARLKWIDSILWTNAEMLKIDQGIHPQVGNHPQAVAAAGQGIRAGIESQGAKAKSAAEWQLRLLIAGAALYIIWHVLAMYARTPEWPWRLCLTDCRSPAAAAAPAASRGNVAAN